MTKLIEEARVQSSYASTTIEGNPLALTVVKALLKGKPTQLSQSEQEVSNYNEALIQLQQQNFSEEAVLAIHRRVSYQLLLPEKSGAYRQEPVFIHNPLTGRVIFLPPDHDDVPRLMKELYDFVHAQTDLDPVVMAGLFHKQFVLIHPFFDGNGRTVRLASTLLLRDLGLNLLNLLSFENYYNRNVSRYFHFVGERGDYYELKVDFAGWLEYFAEGILDELMRLEKALSQAANQDNPLKAHHQLIINYLEQHGRISDKDYARLVSRAKATRVLDFNMLIELGFIERKGKGPSSYYVKKIKDD
ncbi:MAG: Fic family protein [Deinococcales bacterium]